MMENNLFALGTNVDHDKTAKTAMIRVGCDYQAVCPDLLSESPDLLQDKEMRVWIPMDTIDQSDLDEYIELSKNMYGFNTEQALGVLLCHKHNMTSALLNMDRITPFLDAVWTVEDEKVFEKAFQAYGKCFPMIRKKLPEKSLGSLVKYYYKWKKTPAGMKIWCKPSMDAKNNNLDDKRKRKRQTY